MEHTKYRITEYLCNSIALRKISNTIFTVREVQGLAEEFKGIADIEPMYVADYHDTMVIQGIILTFKDRENFENVMNEHIKAHDATKDAFVLTGFKYNDDSETCTLHFHTPLFYKFDDDERFAFCAHMYQKGAISVLNRSLSDVSFLKHNLFNFKILEERKFKESIFEVYCTFKTDTAGKKAISEIFDKYSEEVENLESDCYANCIIGRYDDFNTCYFRAVNKVYTSKEVSQKCRWLHSLGAKNVLAYVRSTSSISSEYPTICSSMLCKFGENSNFAFKLDDFIRYLEEAYLQIQIEAGIISDETTKYLPPFHLELDSTKTSFKISKNDYPKKEISHAEGAYFLIQLLKLEAIEVGTNEKFIEAFFNDTDTRLKAAIELLS